MSHRRQQPQCKRRRIIGPPHPPRAAGQPPAGLHLYEGVATWGSPTKVGQPWAALVNPFRVQHRGPSIPRRRDRFHCSQSCHVEFDIGVHRPSIPNIPFIKFNAVFFQQSPVFVLKRLPPMMLLLIQNVFPKRRDMRRTDGKSAGSLLPVKLFETRQASAFTHTEERRFSSLINSAGDDVFERRQRICTWSSTPPASRQGDSRLLHVFARNLWRFVRSTGSFRKGFRFFVEKTMWM